MSYWKGFPVATTGGRSLRYSPRRASAWLALMGMAASVLLGAGIGASAAASPTSSRDDAIYGGSSLIAALAQICTPEGLESATAATTAPGVPGAPAGKMSSPAKCSHCCLALELSLGRGGESPQPVSYPSSRPLVWHGSVAVPEAGQAAFWPFTRGPPSRT